jgi:hypothetical protein
LKFSITIHHTINNKRIPMKKITSSLLLIGLLSSGLCFAGCDEGAAAYHHGDFITATREFRTLAEQGDAKAQNNLGAMYDKGQGVPQDYAQAVQWYRKAAEHGNAKAQNNLGLMYVNGLGVPQKNEVAYALYNLSAAGDPSSNNKAMSNLTVLADKMTTSEIVAGQALTRELAKPGNFGNFGKALDAYFYTPPN